MQVESPVNLIELLRKMGHDIRAPLGSVISTSDMMAQGIYEPLTPKQTRANERIQRNSRRVLAILDDFITYIKADAGETQLVKLPFDPRVVLEDCGSQVQEAAGAKNLALHLTTSESVPSMLTGDAAAIGRAVLPLLWNAITYTSAGAVQVESDWNGCWVIRVRDSGQGIPADNIPHIFEPFWRGEDRPQVTTAGAGLGLPLALALVKLMNGQLWLEETSPEGSVFCVEIPVSDAA
jgi:signal transduction histidine kinase